MCADSHVNDQVVMQQSTMIAQKYNDAHDAVHHRYPGERPSKQWAHQSFGASMPLRTPFVPLRNYPIGRKLGRKLASSAPLRGVHGEQLLDKVLGWLRNLGPWVRVKVDLSLEDHLEYLLLIVAPERWQPRQEDVKDDAQRPQVCLIGIVLFEHLRCNIIGRAHELVEALFGLEKDGQPEVSCFDLCPAQRSNYIVNILLSVLCCLKGAVCQQHRFDSQTRTRHT